MREIEGVHEDTAGSAERRFWRAYEPVHAVCYFHPRFASAMAGTGLTGFWNGYFAGRAAPLGRTPPEAVAALFFGFSLPMVAKAIPKIWTRIEPEAAVGARLEAAEAVLAELAPEGSLADLRRVADGLDRAVDALPFDGRALAGAWASVERPRSPLARLWLAATVLREHRGDGHVAAATAHGLTGLQASITHVATGRVSRAAIQGNRGWTDGEWAAAERALVERGVLESAERLTADGAALRARIEEATDRLSGAGLRALDDPAWTVRTLTALSRTLIDRAAVPVSNPIGVARP